MKKRNKKCKTLLEIEIENVIYSKILKFQFNFYTLKIPFKMFSLIVYPKSRVTYITPKETFAIASRSFLRYSKAFEILLINSALKLTLSW